MKTKTNVPDMNEPIDLDKILTETRTFGPEGRFTTIGRWGLVVIPYESPWDYMQPGGWCTNPNEAWAVWEMDKANEGARCYLIRIHDNRDDKLKSVSSPRVRPVNPEVRGFLFHDKADADAAAEMTWKMVEELCERRIKET